MFDEYRDLVIQASYFVTAALFILGLKRMSSPVTEKGEHGATAIRSIDSSEGSCQRSIAASVSARMRSRSSTTESGGSPPDDWPRSIEPRAG